MASGSYTLYYFPGSYYSLKVLMALYEKNVPFKGVLINIHSGEASQPGYLKMNPSGEVPVLQHGDQIATDSDRIIDYIDAHNDTGPRLVPDVSTADGQGVEKFRKLLHAIQIDVMTYGIFCNRHLAPSQLQMPWFVLKLFKRDSVDARLKLTYRKYEEQVKQHPALREEYREKMANLERRRLLIMEESNVAAILDDIESVFDQLEEQLQISNKGKQKETDALWLFGNDCTAADITAANFLIRLEMLGMTPRYLTHDKRPLCFWYLHHLKRRTSVVRMLAQTKDVAYVYLRSGVKFALPILCKVGAAVGIAALAAYAFKKYDGVERFGFFSKWFKFE